ncbi:MAG: hypothetical protein Fur0037_22440 [Planctomycetota bacterium]
MDAVPNQQPLLTGQSYNAQNAKHVVVLIHDTFAWNVCGIWNGEIDRSPGAWANPDSIPAGGLGSSAW